MSFRELLYRPVSLAVFTTCFCMTPGSAISQTGASQVNPFIAQIIAQDDSLGKVRNLACISISLNETIRNYTDALDSMDYSLCPEDFTNAFRRHVSAWRWMGAYLERYSDLRGEMHDLFAQIDSLDDGPNTEFNRLQDAIWSTWAEVEATMGN